ncbi:hypothetical protein J7E25_00615 [Agromyces sp. ISL-38]|uniref:hypothetical protein n=1 Tax=Agromyces sp. ISL-38 TaxID=2819107 RepID=UPI001BE5667C|nr:hypothetical protein [Agromyces sp. ISL-38]MBT2497593.1 hypothetical protein [Agromyces sp. ISL-38]
MNTFARRTIAGLGVALAALLFAPVLSSPAYAEDTTPEEAVVVTVPMTFDCSTLTPRGRAYAIANNLDVCGVLSQGGSKPGTVTPYNTVYGNCGSASVSISAYGSGKAYIWWEIESSTGPIITYNTTLYYAGAAGSFSRPYSGWWPGNSADDVAIPYLGSGWATTQLAGSVETLLASCVIGNPSSSAYL